MTPENIYQPGGGSVDLFCYFVPDLTHPRLLEFYTGALRVMAVSARRAGITGRLILATTDKWDIPASLAFDETRIIPSSISSVDDLAYLRVWAWNDFVRSSSFREWTISVDCDVIFVPPREIPDQDPFVDQYAVGLTEEPRFKDGFAAGKPNTGVLFLNPYRKQEVQAFFSLFMKTFDRMKEDEDHRYPSGPWGNRPPHLREWGGDEIVLTAMFPDGALCSNGHYPHDVVLEDITVRVFSSLWNDQTRTEEQGWADAVRMKARHGNILHYTGKRKLKLFDDAAAILQTRNRPG